MKKHINTIAELKKKIEACKELELNYEIVGSVKQISVRWDDSVIYYNNDIEEILIYKCFKQEDIKLTSKTISGNRVECLKIGKEYYILNSVYLKY